MPRFSLGSAGKFKIGRDQDALSCRPTPRATVTCTQGVGRAMSCVDLLSDGNFCGLSSLELYVETGGRILYSASRKVEELHGCGFVCCFHLCYGTVIGGDYA